MIATRRFWVLSHRYVGLVMAGFLLVAGLTGSALAWRDELEALINPGLFVVLPPTSSSRPLDPLLLRDRVVQSYPNVKVASVPLTVQPHRSVSFFVQVSPVARGQGGLGLDDQIFINPYTGSILGSRHWGDITQGMKNFMPFVYRLHYSLALNVIGSYMFGFIALLWTLDSFVGLYLTFPISRRKKNHLDLDDATKAARFSGKSWLMRWRPAWSFRRQASAYKITLDLHRAGSLWLWAALLVMAWSSVAFNLAEVYNPAMSVFFAHQPDDESLSSQPDKAGAPLLNWRQAREQARVLIQAEASRQHFSVVREESLRYVASGNRYQYRVQSSRDIRNDGGSTELYFDGSTGRRLLVWLPTGAAAGDTIRTWITGFHMAAIGGWPIRLCICLLGGAIAVFSITGVLIWNKKRQGRLKAKEIQITRPIVDAG